MVDVEADDVAVVVEIDDEPFDDLSRLHARHVLELDVEAVRLRIVMQLHRSSSRKFRSKNALWTVSPSPSVTTRRNRGRVSPARYTCPQNRMRSSGWISRRTGAASASRHQSRLMEGRLRRTCSSKYRVVFKPRLVLAGGRECAGRPRLVKAGRDAESPAGPHHNAYTITTC